jgi:hypothetical protein
VANKKSGEHNVEGARDILMDRPNMLAFPDVIDVKAIVKIGANHECLVAVDCCRSAKQNVRKEVQIREKKALHSI